MALSYRQISANQSDREMEKLHVKQQRKCGRFDGIVTIVTQLSIDRIDRLQLLCDALATSELGGNVVAAILDENRTHSETSENTLFVNQLRQLERRVEAFRTLSLETILVHRQTDGSALYPINSLRNISLAAAKSELVFLLDVDCIPTAKLFDELLGSPEKLSYVKNLCLDECGAIVIPCFEVLHPTGSFTRENGAFKTSKIYTEYLRGNKEDIQPFMGDRFHRGHRASNYPFLSAHWTERLQRLDQCGQESDLHSTPPCFYPITYEEGYEPYVIMARAYVPRYDPAFAGYGRNKALHLYHLHRLGVRFWGCADVALLHLAHAPSSDRDRLLGPAPSLAAGTSQSTRSDEHSTTLADMNDSHLVSSHRVGQQAGLLKDIKAKYNVARQAITKSCASWAIDGIHEQENLRRSLPAGDEALVEDELDESSIERQQVASVVDCCLPFLSSTTRKSAGVNVRVSAEAPRVYPVGTAGAWWPAGSETLAQELLANATISGSDELSEEEESVDPSGCVRLRRLTLLCSVHLHYEPPVLHIHRFVLVIVL